MAAEKQSSCGRSRDLFSTCTKKEGSGGRDGGFFQRPRLTEELEGEPLAGMVFISLCWGLNYFQMQTELWGRGPEWQQSVLAAVEPRPDPTRPSIKNTRSQTHPTTRRPWNSAGLGPGWQGTEQNRLVFSPLRSEVSVVTIWDRAGGVGELSYLSQNNDLTQTNKNNS